MSGKYGSPAFEILIGRFKFQTRQVISLSRLLQWALHEATYLSNRTWNLNAVEHPSFQTEQYFSSQLLWCSSSTYTRHLYWRGHLKSNQINFIFDCTFRHSTEKPCSLEYMKVTILLQPVVWRHFLEKEASEKESFLRFETLPRFAY